MIFLSVCLTVFSDCMWGLLSIKYVFFFFDCMLGLFKWLLLFLTSHIYMKLGAGQVATTMPLSVVLLNAEDVGFPNTSGVRELAEERH